MGGEYAPHNRAEAQIHLDGRALAGFSDEERAARAKALEFGGFIPATSTPITTHRDARAWWDAAYVRAEHQIDGRGYAKLTDFWNADGTTRKRRLQRRSYAGAGVSLTMPSISQIRKFSAASGHETFDVPVSARFPGGTAQGWVRVTRNSPGQWSVSAPGMDSEAQAHVAEAVSALLEARTISTALTEKTDLRARRARRFAQSGVKMDATSKSGFITGVGYNEASGSMAVKIGNRHYNYQVSKETFARVRGARSPGQAYNILVKGRVRDEEVTSCEKCGRFSAVSIGHRCPSQHRQPTDTVKHGNAEARLRAKTARR